MKTTVFVEVIGERGHYSASINRCYVGKTWKRRPKPDAVAPGAIVVEVNLDVPRDRLDHVVEAAVSSPEPLR